MKSRSCCLVIAWLSMLLPLTAQTTSSTVTTVQVPRLVRISGTLVLTPEAGSDAVSIAGAADSQASLHRSGSVIGVTFALYADETGGAPLWLETQNVGVDNTGHYTVLLGSTKSEGLPIDLFTSGKAQWLGVQPDGQAEQPRIMLLSVPYALKAADAETFGGKPPSAYAPAVTTETTTVSNPGPTTTAGSGGGSSVPPHPLPIQGSGTTNYVPLWTNASTLSSSVIFQSDGNLGIGTTSPQVPLDVTAVSESAIAGRTSSNSAYGVYGVNYSTSGPSVGVWGEAGSPSGSGVFGHNDSPSGPASGVEGQSLSPSGTGVFGEATSTTGAAFGVTGQSLSTTGGGVFGFSNLTTGTSTGVSGLNSSPTGFGGNFYNNAASGDAVGAQGLSASTAGVGVKGVGVALSNTGSGLPDRPLGVWGDTNQDGAGVAGTADDAVGVLGVNDAPNLAAGEFENEETDSHIAPVILTHNSEYHGQCIMDVSGNLSCTGSKSAVVPVDGGSRKVALYAVEAPENWFEDFGSGQLSAGAAVISLEPVFAQTINSGVEYHVFLTPTGDCKGLYVANKTATSFEVRELAGGRSSTGFEYRIVARRKGYEEIRMEDRTAQFDPANYRTRRPKAQPAAATKTGVESAVSMSQLVRIAPTPGSTTVPGSASRKPLVPSAQNKTSPRKQ